MRKVIKMNEREYYKNMFPRLEKRVETIDSLEPVQNDIKSQKFMYERMRSMGVNLMIGGLLTATSAIYYIMPKDKDLYTKIDYKIPVEKQITESEGAGAATAGLAGAALMIAGIILDAYGLRKKGCLR